MPLLLIFGGIGLIGLLASDSNVERKRNSAKQAGADNMEDMKKKLRKVPIEKYCKEAQDIFETID